MVTCILTYAETFSILLRKANDGRISRETFGAAVAELDADVLYSDEFHVLSSDDAVVIDSIGLMRRHNINASDSIALAAYLRHAAESEMLGRSVIVASDRRLIRAAEVEGMRAVDPERYSPTEIPELVSSLA